MWLCTSTGCKWNKPLNWGEKQNLNFGWLLNDWTAALYFKYLQMDHWTLGKMDSVTTDSL